MQNKNGNGEDAGTGPIYVEDRSNEKYPPGAREGFALIEDVFDRFRSLMADGLKLCEAKLQPRDQRDDLLIKRMENTTLSKIAALKQLIGD